MSDRNPARELADSGTPLPWRLTDSETVNDVWQAGLTVVGVDSDAIANVADEWYEPEGQDEDATPWNDAAKIVRAVNALPAGNCVAACVASILGVPLDRVPHFIEFGVQFGDSEDVKEVSHGSNWWAMMLGFLAGRGLWVVELDKVTDADPDEFVLVAGMSPRGVMHQVVYREGRLWHDPHPSRAGVLDVREVLAVRALPGFDHEPTRPLMPATTGAAS